MANGGSQEPSGTDGLQFDRAEYADPAPPSPSASITCRACQQPVPDLYYYELQGQTLCAACARGIDAGLAGGSGVRQFLKAGFFGTAAAVGGAVLIYLFGAITGWQPGIISILAGYMVGSAVRQGSGYRGGRGYQVLAVFLTYSAIAWSYLPIVYQQFQAEGVAEPGARGVEGRGKDRPAAADAGKGKAAPHVDGANAAGKPQRGIRMVLILAALVAAIFVPLVYAAPVIDAVLSFPQGLILLLIYFFGLRQAWRLTRKVALDVRGPFRVGQGGPPVPGVSADG